MQFNLEQVDANINQIQAYDAGQIQLNDTLYTSSMIITADSVKKWPVTSFAELQLSHLELLIPNKPDIVLIGTGEVLQFLQGECLKFFADNKTGFEMMTTAAACRTYNVLSAEGRKVVAGLLL